MKDKMYTKINTSIILLLGDLKDLDQIAKNQERTRSQLLRMIIREYIKNKIGETNVASN